MPSRCIWLDRMLFSRLTPVRRGSHNFMLTIDRDRIGLRRVAASVVLVIAALLTASGVRAASEVRALWVVRTTLASPAAVETMVKTAQTAGFNTLLIQVRGRADLEGLSLSPITSGAADYTIDVVRDIIQRYAVDGIPLDYARSPPDDFDYGREALAAFRQDVIGDLSPADRQKYDTRLSGEPTIY